MSIVSFGFMLLSFIGAVLYRLRDTIAFRSAILFAVNIVFLVAAVGGLAPLWAVLAFAGLGYLALEIVRRARKTAVLWIAVLLLVAMFVYLKCYAIADFTQAIKLNPQYVLAYFNRGTAYSDKRDYARSIKDLNQAAKMNPNFVVSFSDRGFAAYDKRDYDADTVAAK